MLRLGCIERKEKGKTGGAGGPERAIVVTCPRARSDPVGGFEPKLGDA